LHDRAAAGATAQDWNLPRHAVTFTSVSTLFA
jgi:hypothetical protein